MKITSKHKTIYLLKTSDKKNMLKVTTELEILLISPDQFIHTDRHTFSVFLSFITHTNSLINLNEVLLSPAFVLVKTKHMLCVTAEGQSVF